MLKVRVWDKKLKEFRLPSEVLKFKGDTVVFIADDDDFIVQRATGFKDCSGKEIYEGDFVIQELNGEGFVIEFGKIERTVITHGCAGEDSRVEIVGFYFKNLKSGLPYFAITENDFGKHDLETIRIIGSLHNAKNA